MSEYCLVDVNRIYKEAVERQNIIVTSLTAFELVNLSRYKMAKAYTPKMC